MQPEPPKSKITAANDVDTSFRGKSARRIVRGLAVLTRAQGCAFGGIHEIQVGFLSQLNIFHTAACFVSAMSANTELADMGMP